MRPGFPYREETFFVSFAARCVSKRGGTFPLIRARAIRPALYDAYHDALCEVLGSLMCITLLLAGFRFDEMAAVSSTSV